MRAVNKEYNKICCSSFYFYVGGSNAFQNTALKSQATNLDFNVYLFLLALRWKKPLPISQNVISQEAKQALMD